MEDIIVEEVEQPVFQDLYLKAADEDSLMAALINAGIYLDQDEIIETDEEGNVVIVQAAAEGLVSGYSLDIIGTIYKETGETLELEDGMIVPAMSMIDGYHANLRGAVTESQKAALPLIEPPNSPSRVWA